MDFGWFGWTLAVGFVAMLAAVFLSLALDAAVRAWRDRDGS